MVGDPLGQPRWMRRTAPARRSPWPRTWSGPASPGSPSAPSWVVMSSGTSCRSSSRRRRRAAANAANSQNRPGMPGRSGPPAAAGVAPRSGSRRLTSSRPPAGPRTRAGAPTRSRGPRTRHEHRRQRRAEPEQRVQDQHRGVHFRRGGTPGVGVQRRDREAEPGTEERGRHQQHQVGGARLVLTSVLTSSKHHRDGVCRPGRAGRPAWCRPAGPARRRAATRRWQRSLRQEHDPVRAARQPVPGLAGEDRAGRRKGDEDDALHQPGRVDDHPFGFRGHRPPPLALRPCRQVVLSARPFRDRGRAGG